MPTATSNAGSRASYTKRWKSRDCGGGWKELVPNTPCRSNPIPDSLDSLAKKRAQSSMTFTGDALLKIITASKDNGCQDRECISCGFITVNTTEVLPLYLPGGIFVICKECLTMVVDNQPVDDDELEEVVVGLSRILDENA